MGYKFRSTKISFPIIDENDAEVKTYTVDIGSEQFLREISTKGKQLVAELDNIDKEDFSQINTSLKSFIDLVLGAGEFEFLYDRFDKNLFAMIELVRALTDDIDKKMKERLSVYA